MGLDTEVPLAQRDERRDALNAIGVEVMELQVVLIEKPPEKPMGGDSQSPSMEPGEGHHIAIRGMRDVVAVRDDPL